MQRVSLRKHLDRLSSARDLIGVGAACAGAHAGTIRVKHTLRPLGVAMAARDVYDPYKD